MAFIDLGLPNMPGDQLAQKIREHDPKISLVLVTGWALESGDERRLVFDFMMQKPFEGPNDLHAVANQAMNLYDLRSGGENTR